MQKEQDLLKRIICYSLKPDVKSQIIIQNIFQDQSVNWEAFKQLVVYHQVIPVAHSVFKKFSNEAPLFLQNFFRTNTRNIILQSMRFWKDFVRIADAFRQEQILVVPIKGVAFLADLYSQDFARSMADIDLLIQEKDFFNAQRILLNLGYEKQFLGLKEAYWRIQQYHLPFAQKASKDLCIVELHWALDYKRHQQPILQEAWQRLHDFDWQGRPLKALSPEDSFLSLALHLRRFGQNFCLKNVYDALLLTRQYNKQFDWNYCLAMSSKYRFQAAVFLLFMQMESCSCSFIPRGISQGFHLSGFQRNKIQSLVAKHMYTVKNLKDQKTTFFKLHLILYDSFWTLLVVIFRTPREQFWKYYGLPAYTISSEIIYQFRIFYSLTMGAVYFLKRNK